MIIKTRRLLVLIGLILMLPVSVGLILLQTRLGSRATGGEARLIFVPDAELVVRANTGLSKTGFVKVEWMFDPSKIRLASEIMTTNTLKTVVQKTTMEQANLEGKVTIILGLAPTDLTAAPSSDFEIARMQIETVSNTPNDRAELIFEIASLQVVEDDGTAMTVIPTNSGYDLNVVTPTVTTGPNLPTDPSVTPTPTTPVEPTITGGPTATPEPTAIPTAVPTNTPVPTAVPTATPEPTAIPTTVPTTAPSVTPTRVPTATVTIAPNLPTIAITPLPTIARPTSTIVPTPTRIPGKKTCAEGDWNMIMANFRRTRDLRALIAEFYLLVSKGRCK